MRTLLTGLLALWLLHALGQDCTVQGVVSDTASREVVIGASLLFQLNGARSAGATTDANGAFHVTLVPGDHQLLVRAVGYADRTLAVHAEAGATLTLAIGIAQSASQLDQVVVTAGKFEQRVGEVTQSLSVLRPEIVRDKNTTSLKDGLAQLPGVVVVDNDPQIRAGSGYSFGAGSRVMMLVDDLPILSGDIGRPSWSFLPIENLEQVEVIKGASSVLYGSAALSGVINVRTAYPRSEPSTRVSLFSGMYDTPGNPAAKWWDQNPPLMGGASFFHSEQFGPFDLVLGGNVYTDQGWVGPARIAPDSLAKYPYLTNPGGNYEGRARFNIATRWRDRKVTGLTYGVNANVMKDRSSTVLVWDDTDQGFYRSEPGTLTRTLSTQYYIDPFVTFAPSERVKHVLRGRYYYLDNENDNDQANKSHFFYGEYRLQLKLDLLGETRISMGATAQGTTSDSELYSGDPSGSGRNTARTLAGYVQVDKKLVHDKLALSAGARYEDFQVDDYEKAQPVFRAGATYRLFTATYLRASYGQGFRFPTIGERYIRTSVGSLNIYPSGDLQPETSTNVEGGIKQGFRLGRFEGYMDAVAFRQDFDQYVEFTFSRWATPTLTNLGGLGFKSINTGAARITGYEVEATAKGAFGKVEVGLLLGYTHTLPVSLDPDMEYARSVPFAGVSVPVTYANTSYDTTDHVLKYRVTDTFRSDLSVSYRKVFGGFSLRYNSHVRNIDKAFVDLDAPPHPVLATGVGDYMRTHTTGDLVVDARLGLRVTKQLKCSVVVNNLTDLVYAIRPLAAEPPRVWQIVLAYEP